MRYALMLLLMCPMLWAAPMRKVTLEFTTPSKGAAILEWGIAGGGKSKFLIDAHTTKHKHILYVPTTPATYVYRWEVSLEDGSWVMKEGVFEVKK